jgi:hypothetical protein
MTNEQIIEVLSRNGGDVIISAKELGVESRVLSNKIYTDKKLRALFMKDVIGEELPSDVEQMVRDISDSPITLDEHERRQMGAVLVNNLEILGMGLEKSGVKKETIEKLRTMGEFEKNAAKFLVSSLDMMHRTIVYQGVVLFEHSEFLKKKLEKMEKDPDVKFNDWVRVQRAYNATVDQSMKAYDRVLNGTMAMAKLTKKPDKKGEGVATPAFKPLVKD